MVIVSFFFLIFIFNTACIVEIKQYCTGGRFNIFCPWSQIEFYGSSSRPHVFDVRQHYEELQGDVFGTPKVS